MRLLKLLSRRQQSKQLVKFQKSSALELLQNSTESISIKGPDLSRRLPYELLTVIFELAARGHHNFPAVAAVVCSHWRAVALAYAPLWSYIWLDHRSPKFKYDLWKGRLGDLDIPRSITIVALVREQTLTEEWQYITETLQVGKRNFEIRSFHLDGDLETFDWSAFRMGVNTYEEVSLHVDDRWSSEELPFCCSPIPFWPRYVYPDSKPVLSISLCSVTLNFRIIDFSQIRILELFETNANSFPYSSQIMPALQTMSHLQTLVVELIEVGKVLTCTYAGYGVIRMESLLHLQVGGSWPINEFLRALFLPNLQSFVIDRALDSPIMALAILSCASPPLRRLCISRSTVNSERLMERLASFPLLSTVYLLDATGPRLADAFSNRRKSNPDFLSSLQILDIYDEYGTFKRLVPIPTSTPDPNPSTEGMVLVKGEDMRQRRREVFDLVMQRATLHRTCDMASPSCDALKEELRKRLKPKKKLFENRLGKRIFR
ncbi:hypothetical protein SISSUDRAFT_644303 [Sistotremastrum suecicum HHB10207 ss-3]|uniref:F-box domain-containing protein n=1 Tax=Sistotremastrum suecicum HHB10207 ss-3 TaxID=1314776 RepID=A0A166EA35_9AGAM|nr:hypothetical protein SISSUDRAFT_644303 [Sistotremastrum suecicum HHB10207 ss-3]